MKFLKKLLGKKKSAPRQVTSQFWIGNLDSEELFFDFFAEADDYYSEENEEQDDYPLSRFIASQGEVWYDHDFFEPGFNSDVSASLATQFSGHSWAEQWGPLVEAKMKEIGLNSINTFALMSVDNQPGIGTHYQVSSPKSHEEAGLNLIYIGELTHDA